MFALARTRRGCDSWKMLQINFVLICSSSNYTCEPYMMPKTDSLKVFSFSSHYTGSNLFYFKLKTEFGASSLLHKSSISNLKLFLTVPSLFYVFYLIYHSAHYSTFSSCLSKKQKLFFWISFPFIADLLTETLTLRTIFGLFFFKVCGKHSLVFLVFVINHKYFGVNIEEKAWKMIFHIEQKWVRFRRMIENLRFCCFIIMIRRSCQSSNDFSSWRKIECWSRITNKRVDNFMSNAMILIMFNVSSAPKKTNIDRNLASFLPLCDKLLRFLFFSSTSSYSKFMKGRKNNKLVCLSFLDAWERIDLYFFNNKVLLGNWEISSFSSRTCEHQIQPSG